jgi:protein-S-isoprenylcysteine O-methyltransferase Ste14
MNPWLGKALVLVGIIGTAVIRAPHGRRSGKVTVVESRRNRAEVPLLALMWIAMMILPLVSIVTPVLSFADYPLHVVPWFLGTVCLVFGLWFFYRSHADLGTNWSISLELREGHKLVTNGVYEHIRHPMYTAIFLIAVAQALLLPNWLAGPSCLVAFLLMLSLRIGPEEQMMRDRFGNDYIAYVGRTKRLIPGVW